MNKTIRLAALGLIILAAGCKEERFQKAEDGTEYKVIKGDGVKAVAGNVIELNILVKYADSVLFSTAENGMPNFLPYDTAALPKFFRDINEGDSLVIRNFTDSIINAGQGAPWMQKGKIIIQGLKVAHIYPNQAAADSAAKAYEVPARAKAYQKSVKGIEDRLATNKERMDADDKTLSDLLASKNLKADKTKWGTYIVITQAGTGPKLSQNDVAEIMYTGRTLNDSTFDSNTDPAFGHPEPLYVDMSDLNSIIPGWIDGLSQMQKGSKGKLYIPSTLAYGKAGRAPKIGPDENLVFDIEVTDIISRDEYQKKMMERQRAFEQQMQQMQQQQQPGKR